MTPSPRIGVFDSGVGGLTVLRALREQIPDANVDYVADSAHAPYGEKSDTFLIDRSRRITRFLRDRGATLVVVACNTATAAAIAALRAEFALAFVGIEPGIKPALRLSKNGRVGVMATPSTLRSAKFQSLVRTHAGNASLHLQACAGLAEGVEQGLLGHPDLLRKVGEYCTPLRDAGCDTVVLGCTHYPLLARPIQRALGADTRLLDTAQAVAQQTARLWAQQAHSTPGSAPARGEIQAWSNGDLAVLRRMAALCGLDDLSTAALGPL